jgi:hypothetical protein
MAVIVEQAGLMDEEVAALRDAAGAPIDERSASLRRVLIGSEEVLRRRFLALPWELATLAEQTRLSARAGRADFLAGARVQRFIDWTLEQQDAEVLSAEVRDAVGDLREAANEPPEGQEQAAAALLAALTRG